MSEYTSASDLKFIRDIVEAVPEQSKKWIEFDHAVIDAETSIPKKYKELIAIAIALTAQCPYCLDKHIASAKKLNATKEEIAETIMIAAAVRSGAALGYGLLSMKLFEKE
ncbi:Carboxymuconolactone decarboxylase family protein [compost metagenome]